MTENRTDLPPTKEKQEKGPGPKILASRMTSFAFVVRNGAIAPFRPLRQAG